MLPWGHRTVAGRGAGYVLFLAWAARAWSGRGAGLSCDLWAACFFSYPPERILPAGGDSAGMECMMPTASPPPSCRQGWQGGLPVPMPRLSPLAYGGHAGELRRVSELFAREQGRCCVKDSTESPYRSEIAVPPATAALGIGV
eukprot:gene7019-biopygen1440